jgi:hypothetical protein
MTEETISLKDVELDWGMAIKVLTHFVQRAQTKSSYKLQEAGILYRAVNFFSGEEKEMTELQATRLLVNGIHIGQSNGVYTLEEAGLLQTKFLPFIDQELSKRSKEHKGKGPVNRVLPE